MADQANENQQPDFLTPSPSEVELKVSTGNADSEESSPDNPIQSTQAAPPEISKAEELIGKTIDEKYVVLSFIGRGGLGMVYKAKHKIANKVVALKVLLPGKHLDEANIARFKREAKTAMGMKHPNIAGVQDIGFYNSMPYIVMEFVEGYPLYDLLKAEKLSIPDKVSILKQVCQAMEYARKNSVIHRDLKPDNIIVSKKEDGTLKSKIVDFGIAKDVDAKDEVTLTKTGEMFGTPLYMSPEQIIGKKTDHRSDIYSIGCIAYEFMNGHAPFKAESALAILNAHIEEEAPKFKPPEELKGIELVIAKSLSKDKKHRYQTAQEMLDEIELIEQGQKPKATNLPISKKTTKRILIGLIVSCLVFLVGLLAFIEVFKPDTIPSLTQTLQSNPKDVFSLIERGRLYSVSGQFQNAISDYDKAIRYADKDPSNKSIAYIRKGIALTGLGKPEEALKAINKGLEIKPRSYRGYMERATVQRALNRDEDAISDLKKSIEYNNVVGIQQQNKYYAWGEISTIYADNHKWKESLAAAKKALEGESGWISAYYSRARSYLGLGQLKNCIKTCDKILYSNPKSKLALALRGTAYSGLKNYAKALNDFDELASVDPDNPRVFVKRASVYRKMGDLDNAKVNLDKAFSLGAQSDEAYFEKARLLKEEKKYSEALDAINKAISKKSSKGALKLKQEIMDLLK